MKTTQIIICRHGNTFSPNQVVTRVGARTDLPLVQSGIEQAKNIGHYLKAYVLEPQAVFCSFLQRTKSTAEIAMAIAGYAQEPIPLNIFDEIDYGIDENQTESQVVARIGQKALDAWEQEGIVPQGWLVDPKQVISNWHQFAGQVEAGFLGKTVMVVTSNGIARFAPYLTESIENFTQQYSAKIATGAICILEKAENEKHWKVKIWNKRPISSF